MSATDNLSPEQFRLYEEPGHREVELGTDRRALERKAENYNHLGPAAHHYSVEQADPMRHLRDLG